MLRLAAAWGLACALPACAPGESRSAAEEVDGRQAYLVRCSYCHDVPNGIGAELTPRLLAGYRTVGRLAQHVRATMPHEAPGSLADAEYEAIVRYMIESRELAGGAGAGQLWDESTPLAGSRSAPPSSSPSPESAPPP